MNHLLKLIMISLLTTSILTVPGPANVLVPATRAVSAVPMLDVPGQQIVRQASSITFTVNASNPDLPGEQIEISASGVPTGASFPQGVGNPVYSTFSWAPSATQPAGNYTVGFEASDNGNLSISVTRTVIIQVVRAISAPVLTVPLAQSIAPDTILSFAVVAADTNIPPLSLTLSVAGLPRGATFDSASGVFQWRPGADQSPGVYVVIFTARNGQSGIDSKRVSITVIGAVQAGATSTFNLQNQVPSWLLPFSIGIFLGAVAWAWTRTRRSRGTSTLLKSPNEPSVTTKP